MATYAQWIEFGPYFSGGNLCTLRVYHYVTGTTTLKDVYSDRGKTTTVAQPATSDSNGIVSFYADGLYKFRIDGSTDGVTYSTLYTVDNVAAVDQSLTLTGEGAAIASASTLTLGTDGNIFHVTGSTGPITSISGTQDTVTLILDSTPTFANSGNLIMQGSVDLLGVAGSVISFLNEGDGVWREQFRLLASNPAHSGVANPIINGQFNVWQRGATFTSATTPANSDDTYLADRWYVLSDGNDIADVSQGSGSGAVPANGLFSCVLDVETANKKFGIAQIIARENCIQFRGQTCTLSFKSKVSATTKLDNVKAAIVAWSGTADTVTSDIISAWGAEGTNPTLIANATYENVPANLNVTTSYATYSVTATIDTSSTENIIVFIWSDVTDTTAGDFLYITDVKLELGSSATETQFRPFAEEYMLCRRHYQKSFIYGTAPAQNTGSGDALQGLAGKAGATTQAIYHRLNPPMFAAPSVTLYNPSAGNAEMRDITANADCSSTTAATAVSANIVITATGNASTAVGNRLAIQWAAVSEL